MLNSPELEQAISAYLERRAISPQSLPKPKPALHAALDRVPFVPFLLISGRRQILIENPKEISVGQGIVTLSIPLGSIHVRELPENYLIALEEEGLKPAVRMIDPPDPVDPEQLANDPSLAELRTNFDEFESEMEVASKFGFSRPVVTNCPDATGVAQAIELGWFNEIRIGRKNRSPIQDISQLIAVLAKLQYPYLAQGVVTKKGAEQLAAEWDTARREHNKTRMRKKRDRKNRYKIVVRKSRARKKSEKLPKSGDQDPEPIGS
jgi:hypothetical protein